MKYNNLPKQGNEPIKPELAIDKICEILNMELIKILIENSTNEGDLIYDPFAGSCSTLKTAKILNRNSIGSELSKDYCQQFTDTAKSELF